jgi:hypothetical protein
MLRRIRGQYARHKLVLTSRGKTVVTVARIPVDQSPSTWCCPFPSTNNLSNASRIVSPATLPDGTEGGTKAQEDEPDAGREQVTDPRPAARGDEAPTAAPDHPA